MEANAKQKLFCKIELSIQKMRGFIIFLLLISFLSCKTEKDSQEPVDVQNSKVLIVNEGNFNFGNASLSMYNENAKSIENKVFQSNNLGRPIGDVVQSVLQIRSELFVIVNNSSKIEILDPLNLSAIASIQQLNSPRYIVAVDEFKAYVSDLYEDKIYVINPSARTIVKTIDTKGWVEEMVIVGDKLYATHVDSNQVWIFDTQNDKLITKINTNIQPQYIEFDQNNNIWVSCTGGFNGGKSALYHIDSKTDSVLNIFEADNSSQKIGEIEMNGSREQLYYLRDNGLYRININTVSAPTSPFIAQGSRLFYGFSVDPTTDEIYICDAIDYQQKGVVYRYDIAGNQVDAFKTGIIPGDVYFLN